MPIIQPTPGDVHVDMILTDLMVGFQQEAANFVAGRVFPEVPNGKRSDLFFVIPRGAWNRRQMKKRAPNTPSAQVNWTVSNDNFRCDVSALHAEIDDQTRSNQDNPLDLNMQATQLLTTQALIDREVDWVDSYFTSGNPGDTWTFDVDGATAESAAFDPTSAANNNKVRWSLGNSTPIEDVRQGKRFVQSITGYRPNVITLGRPVFDVLVDHPDIVGRLDRGQTSGAAQATRQNLAALFELEEVLVMDAIENTAAEGAADVHAFIGGNHALLSYRPGSPGVMVPSAGYTFTWNGYLGASESGMRIKQFRVEQNAADWVEIESAYDHKLIAPDLGYFFGDIVAEE